MSDRPFYLRLAEHVRSYLAGEYALYGKGNMTGKPIYQGRYGNKDWNGTRKEFQKNCGKYGAIVQGELSESRIFLCPLKDGARIIERIEAALAEHLRTQEAPVGTFYEKGVRYRFTREDEPPFIVKILNHHKILGLPEQLTVGYQ
jgi:hypothetical protein